MKRRLNRKAAVDVITLNALRGFVTPIPMDVGAGEILDSMYSLGGVWLNASGAEIMEKALRYCDKGSRVSYIVTNTVGGSIHISLILDTPEEHVRSEGDLLARGGYVLAYVWNATHPDCSELGDIYLVREADQRIHRRG